MPSLTENIKKIEDLSKIYHNDCDKLIKFISLIRSYAPDIYITNNGPHGGIVSNRWDKDNFHLFDEVKGINIFLLRLLKKYQNIRIKLDNEIEICLNDLKSALKSYDDEVMEFEPMSEYARDGFERDRWNILRPYKELEKLKNEISTDKVTLSSIQEQIQLRELDVVKYKDYTLQDVTKELERIIEIFLKVDL